ncbi:MAG: mannose-1-phosphate guanylyltransferase/mannose-6-phosphate isomerase [Candidatus Omnitrophica bacterium]|nr:mannose-1-phosphate guanylyltransferase/mannose-6-phosphate isomerase [Candidatus Omnitrophota bacterium]
MLKHTYAILLAGGQGSRFWPLSRTLEPKQFLTLDHNKSLFEQTIQRVLPVISPQNIYIATSELYRFSILELACYFGIPQSNIIFENEGKNTAPSVGVGVALIHCRDPQAKIAVLPCDHRIQNKKRFLKILRNALELTEQNLVILGIPPTRAATGYGYIQIGQEVDKQKKAFFVKRFTEKPDFEKAKAFLKSGCFFWNSGIFIGKSEVFLREYKKNLPKLFYLLHKISNSSDIEKIWPEVEPISFDYGILEKTADVIVLVAEDLGWSDLGSWQSWDEILPKDKKGNFFKADVINIDSKNTTVFGQGRLIAAIGLDNVIIVDTADATLITKKDRSEEVKKIVDTLKKQGRNEYYEHKTVKRPWGSYTVLEVGDGFKVKAVEVKPGCSLSLQYHKKRSEHWVVVEGIAKITKGKRNYFYYANQSTYIPSGCVHRLENPHKSLPLKIIEVQTGKYLEEDDIVRIKDNFGRCKNKP